MQCTCTCTLILMHLIFLSFVVLCRMACIRISEKNGHSSFIEVSCCFLGLADNQSRTRLWNILYIQDSVGLKSILLLHVVICNTAMWKAGNSGFNGCSKHGQCITMNNYEAQLT